MAHAKVTGEVGVCVATSSPGAFHLINGLYDANMDNQPVVAIVGQQGLTARLSKSQLLLAAALPDVGTAKQ
ncbi:MAG TPA: thiamine pyrophosphate-binding protein [Acidothermaceae bacterium]